MDKCCGISATELLDRTLSYLIWVFGCLGFRFFWKQHHRFGSGCDRSAQTEESRWQLSTLLFVCSLFLCLFCSFILLLNPCYFRTVLFHKGKSNWNVWTKTGFWTNLFVWRLNCKWNSMWAYCCPLEAYVFQLRTVISQFSKFSAADVQDGMRCGLKALRNLICSWSFLACEICQVKFGLANFKTVKEAKLCNATKE